MNNTKKPCLYACIYKTPPIAEEKADIDAAKGHGLGSTKWKGCRCKFLDAVDSEIILFSN